jgi:CHAT domain-containing protein
LLAGAVFTMGAILGLKLNADWIVLSACNTAAAEGKGAEAVSGLGRAFFYAGARALLVSNWPVETTSAKALTTDLFQRQARDPTLTRAEALQQAMLALIDGPGRTDAQGMTLFSYAHPIFWAPFSLVGDGGGATARNQQSN